MNAYKHSSKLVHYYPHPVATLAPSACASPSVLMRAMMKEIAEYVQMVKR